MKEWTILEILNWTKDYFTQKQVENPRLNAEYILAHVLQETRINLYVRFEEVVSEAHRGAIRACVERRAAGEPLQYVLGETSFYGFPIALDASVLIPRPETEYLVEMVVEQHPRAASILDVGTGSGCIAIALKKLIPDAEITGADISSQALAKASENADANDVAITFIQSDLLDGVKGRFDIIVSNPPYIPEAEYQKLDSQILEFEPKLALVAEEDGMICYRKILQKAANHLRPRGEIYFEIGHGQGEKIQQLAIAAGFHDVVVTKDLNGFDRYAHIW